MPLKSRYDNFIGGEWVKPTKGNYSEDLAPATGKAFAEFASSTVEDIDLAVAAAKAAFPIWSKTSVADRAAVLNRIADRLEENLESIAVLESWENGKPVRETLAADIPLAIDHFRYFAAAIRTQEGNIKKLSNDLVSYHFFEPIGVVAQIIPWNFPLLMAAWKLAPALAAGNTVVLKPASATPISILYVMELIQDILPAGVINVINGSGSALGRPLVEHDDIGKVAFTGSTATGRQIMQYAIKNIIPSTMELGGKSPNIFFDDVAKKKDDFYRKALEGFTMFAFNKGEVCSCPSRALLAGRPHRPRLPRRGGRPGQADQRLATRSTPRPRWVRRTASNRSTRSPPTSTSARRRAAKFSPAAPARNSPATSRAVISSSRPCSGEPTTCGCSGMRSSDRSSPSRHSRTTTKPSTSPTTRSTGLGPACGAETPTSPTRRARTSARVGCGSTPTTSTRQAPASVDTSSPAMVARPTSRRFATTRKSRTSSTTMTRSHSVSSSR